MLVKAGGQSFVADIAIESTRGATSTWSFKKRHKLRYFHKMIEAPAPDFVACSSLFLDLTNCVEI